MFREQDRAELGSQRMSTRQLEAEMAAWKSDFDRRETERVERREEKRQRYSPQRERARLALLEYL